MRKISWDSLAEPRMPEDGVAVDVLRHINILDLIAPHVMLKPLRNGEHSGLCPFHAEKTASFFVNEDKGVYLCRGCNESGNAISWLEKHDGMTRQEAVRHLMVMAGLDDLSLEDDTTRKARFAVSQVTTQAHRGDDSKTPGFIFWDISDVCGGMMKENPDDDEMIDRIEGILRRLDELYLARDEEGLVRLHENYPRYLEGQAVEDAGDEGEHPKLP